MGSRVCSQTLAHRPTFAKLPINEPFRKLISAVQQSQFPHLDSLIHLFVGGSELHGAKVKNMDDLDIYAST